MIAYTARDLALKALVVMGAYADAGTHEEGGNNRGDQVEFFLRIVGADPGNPWCAACVSTCRVKAYAQLTGQSADRGTLLQLARKHAAELMLSGYCPSLWQMGKNKGMTRDRDFVPLGGDLILYDFLGKGEPHHVGMVRSKLANGDIATIEGNTGDRSQADGDGVYRKIRTLNHTVFGFIHFS